MASQKKLNFLVSYQIILYLCSRALNNYKYSPTHAVFGEVIGYIYKGLKIFGIK